MKVIAFVDFGPIFLRFFLGCFYEFCYLYVVADFVCFVFTLGKEVLCFVLFKKIV